MAIAMIVKSTKALFYEKFMDMGDDPAEVICHYLPTKPPDPEVTMAVCTVADLPEGNLYPCLAYSQRYVYNLIHTGQSGSKEYGIEAIAMSDLPPRRA